MTRDNRSVLIGCIYKSPNTSDTNKDKLIDLLRSPLIQSFNYVCIVGDFNYPDIDWSGGWSNSQDNDFGECIRDSYLSQMVCNPTRKREGQRPSLIDEEIISEIEHH